MNLTFSGCLASLFFFIWLMRAFVCEPDFRFAHDLYPSADSLMEWSASPTALRLLRHTDRSDPLEIARDPCVQQFFPLRAAPRSRAIVARHDRLD